MPRASARSYHFHCLTCSVEFTAVWWHGSIESVDGWNRATLADLQHPTAHLPSCAQPHVTVDGPASSWSSSSHNACVRASQRAVVYQFPDGTWASPGTNDPNDPIAQDALRDGAVRREFYHVRDMREFQRGMRKSDSDEYTGRNDVLDFDHASLRQHDYNATDVEALHMREARLRDAFAIIGGNSGRYERALDEARKRGWTRD